MLLMISLYKQSANNSVLLTSIWMMMLKIDGMPHIYHTLILLAYSVNRSILLRTGIHKTI